MQLRPRAGLPSLIILALVLAGCSASKATLEERLPGGYKFEAKTLRHGEDILVLNADHTYVHTYIPLGSRIEQEQRGRWAINEGLDLILYDFVAWGLSEWGPRRTEQEYQNPPPTNTGMSIIIKKNRVVLLINADEGDSFVQMK